ncbi:MAG TPA: NAD(P)-dependent oxidoreductase [Candidatus Baltobacteraceae bacterium]
MKVLVVGGTGAVGAPTVTRLVAAGHEVRSTARSVQSRDSLQQIGVEALDVDIYDRDALRLAMRGMDAVIRLTTKLPKSLMQMRDKAVSNETNRLRSVGAQSIVDAAIAEHVQVYVTESFFAAYRSGGDRWVTEQFPSDDEGVDTLKAILESERQAQRFAREGGRGITLRFGGFYGASNGFTGEIMRLLHKRMLPIIGPGDYYVPSLHIEDAADAVVNALSAASGVYNVCDDNPQKWADFLYGAARMAGAPKPMRLPAFMGPLAMGYPWKWMTRSVRMSNALFKNTTGWRPRHPDPLLGYADAFAQIGQSGAMAKSS